MFIGVRSIRYGFGLGLLSWGLAVALALAMPTTAACTPKYRVQSRDSSYHWGSSGQIWVNRPMPSGDYNKVTVIWGFTTDESSFLEAGHTWDGAYNNTCWAFYAYSRNGVYGGIHPIKSGLPSGSYQKYNIGWDEATRRHWVWMNGTVITRSLFIPEMTSQWPGTSCEKDSSIISDNYGHFVDLEYKAKNNAWSQWRNASEYYDNDPFYYFHRLGPDTIETPHV